MAMAMRTFLLCVFTWTFSLLLGACQSSESKEPMESYPNLPFPTMGGRQLWADVNWFAGWRVQKNVWTGHCRLLDPDNMRRAWGRRPAVEDALFEAKQKRNLQLDGDHLVVLLHGLGRSRSSMAPMQVVLESAGYEVMDVGYPSTRRSIAEHVEQLTSLLNQVAAHGEIEQISFVTHSLGGMVARAALAEEAQWQKEMAVHRLVMLAPPSTGSAIAQSLKDFLPFQWFAGEAGQLLTLDEANQIPLPSCDFGIIAGRRKPGKGYNPLLDGEDDGVVRVDETRLPGAEDFWLVPNSHTFIMEDEAVMAGVVNYLRMGKFLSQSQD